MSYGWVSIHRQIQEHWLWKDKPFSYGQAWIDLIMMANHNDNKFLLGRELVEVKAGSFITSELKLMERWGWGKTRVRTFLELLQKDNMIVKKVNRKRTTIFIVNYSVFQDTQTINELSTNHSQTDCKPIANTNNNDNNVNNENNNIIISDSDESEPAPEPKPKKKSNPKPKPAKHKYGEYKNVLLTDDELDKLKTEYSDYQKRIERLSSYVESTGRSYKSHYATIRNWARNDAEKKGTGRKEIVPDWMNKNKKNNFTGFENQRDYDMDQLEAELLQKSRNTTASNPELAARVEALKKELGQ